MARIVEALAFVVLIGGQFLGAVVVISMKSALYPDTSRPHPEQYQPTGSDQPIASGVRVAEIM